ncbi:MAG: hypothetical protein JXQ75_17600 [Phycisphaerae bacterium]|nr:hypothetical protein [Phycisphaerae bacterium]
MSDMPQRFDHVRRSIRIGRILGFAGMAAIVVLVGYLFAVESDLLASEEGAGFVRVLVGLGVLGVALVLGAGAVFTWGAVDVALKIEANSFRIYDVLRDIHASLDEYRPHLRTIADNAQLSDTARAITHRANERTALRLAINEEIIRGDWEAGYALVELLESRHGYKNEAARLRMEVDRSREQALKHELRERVERVRSYMDRHDWDRARREMDGLIAENPDNEEVRELPNLFADLRSEHKRRLLKEWDESVQRNEIDRGIAVLKELDQFLTPNEAAALEESARGVFRAKLHNLGVQFSLAVADHDWQGALAAGRQIMEEFPNCRMAAEVKSRIYALSARAEEATLHAAAKNTSGG